MATPNWIGASTGSPQLAAQVNEFLGTHAATYVYTGTSFSSQGTVGTGGAATNGIWIAQSFTTGASTTTIGRVRLNVSYTGSPTPVTIGIYATSGTAPTGSALVSTVIPASYFTPTGATMSIPMPYAGLAVSTGYWIVVMAVGDASDFYSFNYTTQTSGVSTSTNGTSWTTTAHGLIYNCFDQSVIQPLAHTWEDGGVRWTAYAVNSVNQPTGLQEYTVAQAANDYVYSSRSMAYTNQDLISVT